MTGVFRQEAFLFLQSHKTLLRWDFLMDYKVKSSDFPLLL